MSFGMQSMESGHWYPPMPPYLPPSRAFWESRNVYNWLTNLKKTLIFAKAMEGGLQTLKSIKEFKESGNDLKNGSWNDDEFQLVKHIEENVVYMDGQEFCSVQAANALILKLRGLLEPFRVITDETSPWEEKSSAFKLSNRIKKSRRNKIWRKKKRRRVAEQLAKERESFDEVNRDAGEWRAREIANDSAKVKVKKMNEIAKLKAKEERKKLESEGIFSRRRMMSSSREFEMLWRKKRGRHWPLQMQIQQRKWLPWLMNLGESIELVSQGHKILRARKVERWHKLLLPRESWSLHWTASKNLTKKPHKEKISLELMIQGQISQWSSTITITEVARTWARLLR